MQNQVNKLLVLVGLVISLFLIYKVIERNSVVQDTQNTTKIDIKPTSSFYENNDEQWEIVPYQESDHIIGSPNSKLVLIEYTDIGCTDCATVHESLLKIQKAYEDEISLILRPLPLQLHSNATKPWEAAECSIQNGSDEAYWIYTNKLISQGESINPFDDKILENIALESNLNIETWKTCLTAREKRDIVNTKKDTGTKSGIGITPSIIVYEPKSQISKLIAGNIQYDMLKEVVEFYLTNVRTNP